MSDPQTLLGLLEREPSHGYDLKRDYDVLFGRGRPLPFGQLYATPGRLARDGKVVVGNAEPGAGPDRKRYVITEQGATEVDAWLTEPASAARASSPAARRSASRSPGGWSPARGAVRRRAHRLAGHAHR